MSGTPSFAGVTLVGVKLVGETHAFDGHGDDVNNNSGYNSTTSAFDSGLYGRLASSTTSSMMAARMVTGDMLGFVAVTDRELITLDSFRNQMRQQIEHIPEEFQFLTKKGWPVSRNQENALVLQNILTGGTVVLIRKKFDRPRVGIQTLDGLSVGFIFADMNSKASDLRQSILEELKSTLLLDDFVFLDKNGWPVTYLQENQLSVWDIINNGVLTISSRKRISINSESNANLDDIVDGSEFDDSIGTNVPSPKKQKLSINSIAPVDEVAESDGQNLSAQLYNDSKFLNSNLSLQSISSTTATEKPILISYVRAEAEHHARHLKSHLTDLGCNVYLDVDEIQAGHDWQDALNKAVLGCGIFVPIITPQYGYTQWTNREVKLADMQSKLIIPINFLDYWPPECLAIQFVSTQFVPWKSRSEIDEGKEREGERAADIKYWDQFYIQRTATQIVSISQNDRPASGFQSHGLEAVRTNNLDENLFEIPDDVSIQSAPESLVFVKTEQRIKMEPMDAVSGPSVESTFLPVARNHSLVLPTKRRPSIVITAHPKQSDFVGLIRTELSKLGYDVWSSTDMQFGTNSNYDMDDLMNSLTSVPNTPMTPMVDPWYSAQADEADGYRNGVLPNSSSSQESNFFFNHLSQMKRKFQLNLNTTCEHFKASQGSQCSQESIFSPEEEDKARVFRRRVQQAHVVIVIVSEAYCSSRTCKIQAMYCDYRKTVVGVQCEEEVVMPHWLTKVIEADDLIPSNCKSKELEQSFCTTLTARIESVLLAGKDSKCAFKMAMTEARTQSLVSYISKRLPIFEKKRIYVYIAGGTKFYNQTSQAISTAIGAILASKDYIVLVTGGLYGAAEAVSRSFDEERKDKSSKKLYHVLPKRDTKDFSMKCRQKADGSFDRVPFGQTEFVGDSFQERDSVVARLFHYCILIEGGPASNKLAQEFLWNDNIVIPVMSSGGAAAGTFQCPEEKKAITDMPAGVCQNDWATLSRTDASPDSIANSILHILGTLRHSRCGSGNYKNHLKNFRQNFRMRNKSGKGKTKKNSYLQQIYLDVVNG